MKITMIILLLLGLLVAIKLENDLLRKENAFLRKRIEKINFLYGEQDKIINNILKNE